MDLHFEVGQKRDNGYNKLWKYGENFFDHLNDFFYDHK